VSPVFSLAQNSLAATVLFLEGVQALAGWKRTFRVGNKSPINSDQVSCAAFDTLDFLECPWNEPMLDVAARCRSLKGPKGRAKGPRQRDFVSRNSSVTGFESLAPAHQDDNAGQSRFKCAHHTWYILVLVRYLSQIIFPAQHATPPRPG